MIGKDLRASVAAAYGRFRETGSPAFPEALVKSWLEMLRVPVPPGRVAGTAKEACRVAEEVGYPVVVKVSSARMLHKTESGAVVTGIRGPGDLRLAFAELRSLAGDAPRGDGFEGVLVEKQVPAGVEVIAGLQNDPHFGPVLMVGIGGTMAELLDDVTFMALPVGRSEVRRMLSRLRGLPLLKGFRGFPPCDMRALEDAVLGIARLGADVFPYMESADFNPVIVSPGGAVVVDAKVVLAEEPRHDAMEAEDPRTRHLSSFFDPASVAVIGASASPGKIGNVIVDSLANHRFRGRVYPINPNRGSILGIKCYPGIAALPEPPELAVMVVDLVEGPRIMRELAAAGTHTLLVVSGGGKELGGVRQDIEREMARLSRELDIRVIGPNCIGAFDGESRFDSFFHSNERLRRPPAGPMSFITQSGTWGCAFLEAAEITGVAKMVSYGNRVDVDEGDLVAWMASDPSTRVIGSYIEGLERGRKFLAAAKKASREHGKPLVAFKTGRTRRSAAAAVSHTGAFGGSYGVYEGVLEQASVITTDSFHEMFAACQALALQPAAAGARVAMLSNGAGPMVNALDLFPNKGLELVRLTRSSVRAMRDHFSFFYLVENPVDVTGSASAEDYEFVIRTLLEDPRVDLIMPFFVFQDTPLDESIVERIERLNAVAEKPIVGCASGGQYTREMSAALEEAGVPVFPDVAQWVAASSALVRWGGIKKGH